MHMSLSKVFHAPSSFTFEKEFSEKSQNIWENSFHNSEKESVLISKVHQVVPEIMSLQAV